MKRFFAILSAVLMLTMVFTTTCFASEIKMYDYNGVEMAEFPFYDADNYPYLLMYTSGSAFNIMASDGDFYVNQSTGSVNYKTTGKHIIYNYANGAWKELSTINHNENSVTGVSHTNVHWVTHPLMSETGEAFKAGDPNFFPLPELMAMVTEKTLVETTVPKMMTDLSTLIPLGIGLMACLIGLPLFGKVLRRFLT